MVSVSVTPLKVDEVVSVEVVAADSVSDRVEVSVAVSCQVSVTFPLDERFPSSMTPTAALGHGLGDRTGFDQRGVVQTALGRRGRGGDAADGGRFQGGTGVRGAVGFRAAEPIRRGLVPGVTPVDA